MKIGIIQTAFIGDVVLTGLLVEGLHQAGHEIIFFTKAKTSPIFQYDRRVSKVITLNKPSGFRKILAFPSMLRQIKHQHLDAILCPHRSFTTTLCAYLSGVKLTVGFQNAALAFLYKMRKPYILSQHECLRYLNLIPKEFCSAKILEHVQKLGRPILRLTTQPAVVRLGQTSLDLKTNPYFVLAIGSMWNTKKYPRDFMLEICKHILSANPNLICYLTGDSNDVSDCQILTEGLNEYATRIINTAGKLNLADFVNILAKSKFIVSNDSSPLHFSSAFNIPLICFWGPTAPEKGFGPLADHQLIISHKTIFGEYLPCQPCGTHGAKICPKKHHLCMKKMTPEFVIPKIKNFLNSQVRLS